MRTPISSRPLCNCQNLTFADEARNDLCDWSAGLFGEKLSEQTRFGAMIAVCVHDRMNSEQHKGQKTQSVRFYVFTLVLSN